ncbi:hypothetical protein RN001_002722 [Aquatica leii]|uniref:CYTH domain-containing protein n=1 Tax=Aquatica leii TaxID=1421715 RepID=A0AAN7PMR2_9COLE|nr:hypothetical protein RN001_002722 [Aquatica leii]
MRNIEIKAKVRDLTNLLSKAEHVSNSKGCIINQYDTFYKVPQGRLKLRKFESGDSELIFYERPDAEGPKMSSYEKCCIKSIETDALSNVLGKALGFDGTVKKTRHLFMVEKTRIHVDIVEGLGTFMELEVALGPNESIEEGEIIARLLMKKLGIDTEDLLAGAYSDMLKK